MAEKKQNDGERFAHRIKGGIRWREMHGQSKRWKKWYDYFINKHSEGIVGNNIVDGVINALLSRLVLRRPRLVVTATEPGAYLHAKIVERVLNYLMVETDMQTTQENAGLYACLYGTGPMILGYDSEFGFAQEYLDWEHKRRMAARAGMPEAAEVLKDETLSQRGRDGALLEYDMRIKAGLPWCIDTAPENWVMPFGTRTVENMPWFAHRVWRRLEDVKRDEKYDMNRGKIKATALVGKDETGKSPKIADRDFYGDIVVLWEMHDAETREVLVWPDGEDFLIRKDSDDLQIEGLPTEVFVFKNNPKAGWGLSDMLNLEDHQKDMNNVATQFSKIAKRTVAAWVFDEDAFDKAELAKLTSEGIFPYIRKKGGVSMADAIKEIKSDIPPALITAMAIIEDNARKAVGLSPAQLGQYVGETHHPAREFAEVGRAVEFAVDRRRQKMMTAIRDIARKEIQMLFTFSSMPRIVQIAGPEAEQGWISFTGQQIKGEYKIDIDPESAIPESHESRKGEAKMIYEALVKDPFFNDPNQPEVGMRWRKVLLEQFKWLEMASIIPEPTPNQMQKAMPLEQAGKQFQGATAGAPPLAQRIMGAR